MNFNTKFLIIFALCCLALAGWSVAFPSGTWRYKLTITIETPEGLKTGYAVRQVTYTAVPKIFASSPGNRQGEAVVIDLGKRGVVFAIMSSGNDSAIVFSAFPYYYGGSTKEGIKYYRSLRAGPIALPEHSTPRFVMFKNIRDPMTATSVYSICSEQTEFSYKSHVCVNRFENLFGKDVKLHSITIEMTNEKVTWIIDRYLPWIKIIDGRYLDDPATPVNSPLWLHGGHFQVGKGDGSDSHESHPSDGRL